MTDDESGKSIGQVQVSWNPGDWCEVDEEKLADFRNEVKHTERNDL